MKKFIKNLILFIILIVLIGAFGVFGYLAYVDINASNARDYLMEKYEFEKKELFPIKSVEYVYKDIANCETLWFKKCTDDENLANKYTFKIKNSDREIIVTEDVDGNFTDDYENSKENDTNSDSNNNES